MDAKYICDALRDKLNDCQCAAYGRCECGCGAVWPEDVASGAADIIESQSDEIARLTAENERLRGEKRSARAKLPAEVVGAVLGTDIDDDCLAVCLCTQLSDSRNRPDDDQNAPIDDDCGWSPWVCERYENIRAVLTKAVSVCIADRLPREAALAAQPSDAEVSDGSQ